MLNILLITSLFGILQGAVILALMLRRIRKMPVAAHLLCLILLECIVVMMLITAENVGWVVESRPLLLLELGITYSVGPLLYFFVRHHTSEKSATRRNVFFQFFPALFMVILAAGGIYDSILPGMIHLHFYIIAGGVSYWIQKPLESPDSGRPALRRWAALLLCYFAILGVAQWVRFVFSETEALKLIVPTAASAGFYLLTLAGFRSSPLLQIKRKALRETGRLQCDGLQIQLEQLMREKQLFREADLTLNKTALALGVAPARLSQYIRAECGQGFPEYINSLRVEKARNLLLDPEYDPYTIEALAREAGFRSRSVFYAVFKEKMGITPLEYKRKSLTAAV